MNLKEKIALVRTAAQIAFKQNKINEEEYRIILADIEQMEIDLNEINEIKNEQTKNIKSKFIQEFRLA